MEKIYSRRRFIFPKINKFKLILIIIILILLFLLYSFVIAGYKIFEASCRNKASSIAINISTEEVNKVMNDYEYEDLISIEKTESGDIAMVKANIIPINEMIAKVASNIKNRIDSNPQVEVGINLGAITGFSGLSAVGPKLKVKMEAAGDVSINVNSEFTSVRN